MKIENKKTLPNSNDETGLIIETFANDDTIDAGKGDTIGKSDKKNSEAIVIFDRVQTKLKISPKGKIYRQRVGNFIPIIGPMFSTIYANVVLGKTRCLRKIDALNFKKLSTWINIFAFLIWPIIFLGFWTLMSYLIADMSNIGVENFYTDVLWGNYIAEVKALPFAQSEFISGSLARVFIGLFEIAIFPLRATLDGTTDIAFNFGGVLINTNLIFMISIILLLWINPVHIFNSIMFNVKPYTFKVIELEEYLKLY